VIFGILTIASFKFFERFGWAKLEYKIII
jgi:hypothetical protein